MRSPAGVLSPRRLLLPALVLGVATVALPAIAGSETTPTIAAVNAGVYTHYWSPSKASVGVGGQVTFTNQSEVAHGVEWRGALKPICEEGAGKVPVGSTPSASGTKWSGNCTFSQAGTYSFYCTVHGPEMSGTISVGSTGTTTTTTTGTTTTTTGTTTPTTTGGGPAGGSSGPAGLLAGPAARALTLARRQRHRVHGSLAVSQAAAGGRFEVDLLAARASLASAGHARVRVGRLVRNSLHAGTITFSVALDRRARRALRRHGRLALTVRIVLAPVHGAALTVTRSVLVH